MSADSAVDAKNPWLGLASFTEETRQYFFGRDEEVAELARRVQRKLLSVLFGQSGLGKTSILRAGLVPRLRGQGYCPVYVRIDYGAEAPSPADQIKQAIAQTARRSGEWTQAGVAVAGESLWEFLHHRDDVLKDEAGATLIPLLIFDQFEEIFTVAQSDDAGKARAARFITDLADLVENRPPREVEAKFDADETAAEKFDFARSDYRVLLALREDYLAKLESLKGAMPSVVQNRVRLAPMTGTQALAAVLEPGKGLVSQEVAAAIVRFVAGGAEIANAEVEPSLLSLICRELNDTRIAQGRKEISLDLLDGSQSSILSNFYERSLADQPIAARRIIEDQLLTASGFRENIAEERLLASFKAANVPASTLSTLVNRRLLRIEDRLDIRRVELTHDVLCGVVKSSRDLRHEREAREATARLLEEQRVREAAAHAAMIRARRIAAACASLAVLALVAAVFAVISTRRAHRAEEVAQQTRSQAEQARGQAERLLGYLTDDFATQLEELGRLDVVADIAKREVDYFAALPENQRGGETLRPAILANVQYAHAERLLGNIKAADAASLEAVRLGELLGGDHSEPAQIARSRAYAARAAVLSNLSNPKGEQVAGQAADIIAPLASKKDASAAARTAYADALVNLGFEQSHGRFAQAKASLELAQGLASSLGAQDLKNLQAAVLYIQAGVWLQEALTKMGKRDDARRVGVAAARLADRVLDLRPTYYVAIHAEQVINNDLGVIEAMNLSPRSAMGYFQHSLVYSDAEVKLNPTNSSAINNRSVDYLSLADAEWSVGDSKSAIADEQRSNKLVMPIFDAGSWFIWNSLFNYGTLALRQSDAGLMHDAQLTLQDMDGLVSRLRKQVPANAAQNAVCFRDLAAAATAIGGGDAQSAQELSKKVVNEATDVVPVTQYAGFYMVYCRVYGRYELAQADYLLGDFAGAELAARESLEMPNDVSFSVERDRADDATWQALALVRLGRLQDAAKALAPAVKLHRALATKNHGDETQIIQLAAVLYVQALTEAAHRAGLLKEAGAMIDHTSPGTRSLASTRRWRSWISAASSQG